jgi:hypothetical protein
LPISGAVHAPASVNAVEIQAIWVVWNFAAISGRAGVTRLNA